MTDIAWLPAAGVLVITGVAAVITYLGWFGPAARRHRALARQAARDYAAARGSAHLALLRRCRARLEGHAAQISASLAAATRKEEMLKRERSIALVAALEAHLAQDCFEAAVDGVGPVLARRILARTFHGHLADLTRASDFIDGIGANRQQAINQWVRECQRRQPVLLETQFPGKTEILQRYAAASGVAGREMAQLTADQSALQPQLAQVEQAIAGLEQVTVHDFERALAEPNNDNPALAGYLRGVFAEWEAPPAWFAQLTAAEATQ